MGVWEPYPDNPIITRAFPQGYGDPDVTKVGSTYIMYLAGTYPAPSNPEGVAVFRALSTDGRAWTIDPSARLAPSASPAKWDGRKIETPSLVYFGNQWHLYYCGIGDNGHYQIGHATSKDLYNWTKSRSNPLLRINSITDGSSVLHVCEPGAVVFKNKIYLFFAVAKARPVPGTLPPGQHSIYLAVSKNSTGDSFTTPVEVLTQGSLYPPQLGYTGYSTPDVYADGGTLHLFHCVYWYNGDPSDPWGGYYQVAIAHASSADGTHWTEDGGPIFTRDRFAWTAREIHSPSVLRDEEGWKMWFDGDDVHLDPQTSTYTGRFSIGYATASP